MVVRDSLGSNHPISSEKSKKLLTKWSERQPREVPDCQTISAVGQMLSVYGKFLQMYNLCGLGWNWSDLRVFGFHKIHKWPDHFYQNISLIFSPASLKENKPPPLVWQAPLIFSKWAHVINIMLINDNLETMKRLTIGGRAILIIEYRPNNLYTTTPLSLSSIYLTIFKAIFSWYMWFKITLWVK